MKKTLLALLLPLFVFSSCEEAGKECDIAPKSQPHRLVNDLSDVLTPEQEQKMESILEDYSVQTSTDIAVLTVNDLCAYEPGPYAFKVIDTWGIGKADKDNGLLILVVPKETSATGRGHCFIATGRGLEGAIPDAIAKRIVEDQMIPLFKQGLYFDGILTGVNESMQLASKDFQPNESFSGKRHSKEPRMPLLTGILLIGGVVLFWAFYLMRKTGDYSRTNKTSFWTSWFLMSSMNRHHGGYWGGFRGGGGGGGGWGGFGGGSSGGGGAGGSW